MFSLILCLCIEFMILHKSIIYHVILYQFMNLNDLLIYFQVMMNKIIY